MANLKEIRNRISSVSSTMQITSAMKMVSAAKLKKAQDAITTMRPYAEKLTQLLQNLSGSLDGDVAGKYSKQRNINNVLIVVITSNRGLCGAFNSNVLKEINLLVAEKYAGKKVDFLSIGKRGNDILRKSQTIIRNESTIFDDLTYDNAAEIAEYLMQLFADAKYDTIEVVYNQFKNAATQIVVKEQFLPIIPQKSKSNTATDYIFEPSKDKIVLELIPKMLKTQLYKAIRDSFAAEHGARMTAMHKATDNATELRDQLKLTYNKARQAAITGEILEIVGGAEALNG